MRNVWLVIALLVWAPHSMADNNLDLDRYVGKVVVVDFWASWCVPCRRSFPWLNEMHDKYAEEGLVIIAVNVDRDADNAAAFLARYAARFQVVYDPEANLAKEYEVQVMPSSFVIGKNGEVIEQHAGFKVKRQSEYEAVILTALR